MPVHMHALYLRYGNFLFRYRNILFPAVLLSLVIQFKPVPFLGSLKTDLFLDIAGMLFILAGLGLRATVIGLAYIKRGGVNKNIHADTLVTSGLFSHCRNPLYAGNLLVLCGLFIIYNNPWVYLLGGGFFVLSYAAIVRAEELYLSRKFGDTYKEYCNRVNRWTFTTRGLRATMHSMEFNWARVIAKDYTTLLTWTITVIIVLGLEHVQYYGLQNSYGYAVKSAVLIGAAVILACLVRTLKKHGKLVKN